MICLKLIFEEIPHEKSGYLKSSFDWFGCPKDAQTPCWPRLWTRDLARTGPAYLLDRQFPGNLLFEQAKIFIKNFQF